MKEITIFILCIVLFGCLGQGNQPACKSNNDCLEQAFLKCERYSGEWIGKNGNFSVAIIGGSNNSCSVFIGIPGTALNISKKNMTCNVPLDENTTFNIEDNCTGELKKYFSD